MRKHIFTAGPAVLPVNVLAQASAAVKDLDDSGQSILEISHRSKTFVAIIEEARQLVKEYLHLDDQYDVLFLQGGASTQFCMVPYNLLGADETAVYIDTGSWASKAIKEARRFGTVDVAASSAPENYNYIPKGLNINPGAKYLHVTSNNTIYGTQVHAFPQTDILSVVDMSSDIFCRDLDGKQFDLIYAGAQKNLGPAGTTLVAVKKAILEPPVREIPSMLDYLVHIEKDSLFNTPPVFSIYVCLLTLRWIGEQGGVGALEKINREKAALLYKEIDENDLFTGTAAVEDRSMMNVTFVMADENREKDFLDYVSEQGVVGIKGHRSVGGFRASLYNALPTESVSTLVELMREFTRKFG